MDATDAHLEVDDACLASFHLDSPSLGAKTRECGA
jgi:hypothetical protein